MGENSLGDGIDSVIAIVKDILSRDTSGSDTARLYSDLHTKLQEAKSIIERINA